MVKRRYLGGVILCLALIAPPVLADLPTTVLIGTLPQPAWSQLTTQQKIILAPLANEWEGMENVRKKKWLGIADRYPSMKPDEQLRTQERTTGQNSRQLQGFQPTPRRTKDRRQEKMGGLFQFAKRRKATRSRGWKICQIADSAASAA